VIVVDTHIWIWWVHDRTKLSKRAISSLEAGSRVGVPAICMWEIAMLVTKKRLVLDSPVETWLDEAIAVNGIEVLPLTPRIVSTATQLAMHPDPADRLIVATALAHDAPLVTVDSAIRKTKLVRCIA